MMKNLWSLEGKTVLVTGGSEGIGRAAVEAFLERGANVVASGRSRQKLEALQNHVGSTRLKVKVSDVTKATDRAELVDFVLKGGGLDVLVNNAGSALRSEVLSTEADLATHQMTLNFEAAIEMMKEFHAALAKSSGSIVNVTSVAAHQALPQRFWYGSAKAALSFATKGLATEWAKTNVRVNAVAPWFTKTELTKTVLQNPDKASQINRITPLGRPAEASEVAAAIVFLSLPAASYITGHTLVVDGGTTTQIAL